MHSVTYLEGFTGSLSVIVRGTKQEVESIDPAGFLRDLAKDAHRQALAIKCRGTTSPAARHKRRTEARAERFERAALLTRFTVKPLLGPIPPDGLYVLEILVG